MFTASTLLLLSAGVLAFGAEYAWAYAPVLVLSMVTGVLGILRGGWTPTHRWLMYALAGVALAIALQLNPLSKNLVTTVSPVRSVIDFHELHAKATIESAEERADRYGDRTLSIAPDRTALGLTFLIALSVLLVGSALGMAAITPGSVARGVMALAALVAIVSLAQQAIGGERVYGFWLPPKSYERVSAPFVNKNHTAGWLVMAWSLTAGYVTGIVTSQAHRVRRDWRSRLVWFSSAAGSEVLLGVAILTVVAISIVATASRSGLLALIVAVVTLSWWMLRRQPTNVLGAAVVISMVFIVAFAAVRGDVTAVLDRFDLTEPDVVRRVMTWQDAFRITSDFLAAGTGFNTFGIAMLHYQTLNDGERMIEAHNDYLQVVAEGGVLVVAPVLIVILTFACEVYRRFKEGRDNPGMYWLRAGSVAGILSIAVQEGVDFTLQMPGAAVLFAVLAAIAIHRPHDVRNAGPATAFSARPAAASQREMIVRW